MRNVESKFRYTDHDGVRVRAMANGAADQGIIEQRDVFFMFPQGRLKLRYINSHGKLISYKRDNAAEARPSDYRIFSTYKPQVLEELLGRSFTVVETSKTIMRLLIQRHTD